MDGVDHLVFVINGYQAGVGTKSHLPSLLLGTTSIICKEGWLGRLLGALLKVGPDQGHALPVRENDAQKAWDCGQIGGEMFTQIFHDVCKRKSEIFENNQCEHIVIIITQFGLTTFQQSESW